MNVTNLFKRKKKTATPTPQHTGKFVVNNSKDYLTFQYYMLMSKLASAGIRPGVNIDKVSVIGSYKINTFIIENPQDGVLTEIGKMNKSHDLPMSFGISQDRSLRISYAEGDLGKRSSIMVEIPKTQQYQTTVNFGDIVKDVKAYDTAIGMTSHNLPAFIKYDDATTAHALVGGATGSGKTNLLKAMALSSMQNANPGDAHFIFIDLKKGLSEWGALQNSAFLACPIVTQYDQAAQVLAWLKIEEQRRYQRNQMHNEKPIYIYTDELDTLVFGDKDVSNMFGALHGSCRGAKIYFISGTTTANKELFGDPRIKNGMTIRIVGGVSSPEESKTITGRAGIGAEALKDAGDFIFINKGTERVAVPEIHEHFWDNVPRGENYILDLKGVTRNPTRQATAPAQRIEDISAVQAVRNLDEKLLSLCVYATNKKGESLGRLKISKITKALKLNGDTKGYSPDTVKEYMELAQFIKTSGSQVKKVQAYYENNKHLLK